MNTDDELAKLKLLVDDDGIARLRAARVTVLGLGGVGSHCALALARSGIGQLTLVDADTVSLSNINRQAFAFHSTLGKAKTEIAQTLIRDIDPDIDLDCRQEFVLPETLDALLAGAAPDFIVDCIDTVATKLALARWACEHGVPLVSSMGAGNKYHPELLEFADIYDTAVCPLCKVVRKEARARDIARMRVLYSKEKPIATEPEAGAARSERANIGTMSYYPAAMGTLLAADCIRTLLGVPAM